MSRIKYSRADFDAEQVIAEQQLYDAALLDASEGENAFREFEHTWMASAYNAGRADYSKHYMR